MNTKLTLTIEKEVFNIFTNTGNFIIGKSQILASDGSNVIIPIID